MRDASYSYTSCPTMTVFAPRTMTHNDGNCRACTHSELLRENRLTWSPAMLKSNVPSCGAYAAMQRAKLVVSSACAAGKSSPRSSLPDLALALMRLRIPLLQPSARLRDHGHVELRIVFLDVAGSVFLSKSVGHRSDFFRASDWRSREFRVCAIQTHPQ